VDRFVLVVCEALANDGDVPDWLRAALPELPGLMAASDRVAGQVERASLDLVEAALLVHSVGQEFDAVVVSGSNPGANNSAGNGANGRPFQPLDRIASSQNGSPPPGPVRPFGTVQLADPPVTARCEGEMESGTTIRVRLVEADIRKRTVLFERV
jgi:hypothetical protein